MAEELERLVACGKRGALIQRRGQAEPLTDMEYASSCLNSGVQNTQSVGRACF